jgi:hypothetical protein
VNQGFYVNHRSRGRRGRWRFDPRAHDSRRTGNDQRRRDFVNRSQRQDRSIVIVQRGLVIRVVMVENAVGLQMAMNDGMNVSLFLGLVDVLGRDHGEQPQHDAERSGEEPGHHYR